MSKEPVKEDPAQAKVYPKGEGTVAPEGEQKPEGRYHGLSPEQVKKIEDARYDDTDSTTPIDDGVDAQRRKEEAKAHKDQVDAEEAKARKAKADAAEEASRERSKHK